MVRGKLRTAARLAFIGCALLASASLEAKKKPAPPPPPPPPAPPPPVIVYVPYKPTPPDYASPHMAIPARGADGLYYSVNRGISPNQAAWNLRSGYNVAALGCYDPKHKEVLINYKAFLKTNAKTLSVLNKAVDAEWRKKYGAGFVKPREKFMTEVYNHFAAPPTMPAFCDAMLAVSRDAKLIKPAEITTFATRSLPSIEIVFDDFFRRFDQYRTDLAAWQSKWGDAVPGSAMTLPAGTIVK